MDDKRLKSIKASGLQGLFTYEIEFSESSDTIILIAPNGFGKTAFLALINACLQFNLIEAEEHNFETLDVIFEDGSRWLFTKATLAPDEETLRMQDRSVRLHGRRIRRRQAMVKVEFYDQKGRVKKSKDIHLLEKAPIEVLALAVERALPVSRETFDTFRDIRHGDIVHIAEIIERYKSVLLSDSESRDYIGRYSPGFLQEADDHMNCVFIETQRLLFSKRPRPGTEISKEPEEEILRQAQHLASILQNTYANYASTSQSLDRSFPNRLIARAEGRGHRDTGSLRSDLDSIEARRKALTEAGILIEDAAHVIAPKDEFLPNVADALAIYVEDSKKKLEAFEEIYPKVSVFRELLSKKLAPKELVISRDKGAEVRGRSESVPLDRLSSGEKHEFIMLFRLIFETPSDSLVLIDEPEISLHVAWQLEFMSDLRRVQGANRFQCIIATHSPQIIQGAENIVFDLSEQVT